jgi:lipopolysaccharide transport system permease protein
MSQPSASELPTSSTENWDLLIGPRTHWWDLQLGDVWRYRDLLWLFVRRDFVSVYKQTVLGPIWFIIQLILTALMFTLIFGNIAKIPTDGFPPVLFHLAGITPWKYFSGCLLKTSNSFIQNAGIFREVYFPRLISPLSVVISSLIQFIIQFALFVVFLLWFGLQGAKISPNYGQILFLTPLLLLLMGDTRPRPRPRHRHFITHHQVSGLRTSHQFWHPTDDVCHSSHLPDLTSS